MKKSLSLIVVFSLFAVITTSAQTVNWLTQPNYDTICYYSTDIFKCVKNNKIQLINLAGKQLLKEEADSITDFTEGYALVLNRKGEDYQIKGFLKEKSQEFIHVNGTFYACYYSHFSEGLLVVADEKNEQGYLDTHGVVSIPCKYKKARPFVQGWACVESQDQGAIFIDKTNSPLTVHFNNGILTAGTNFNEKGEAFVGFTKNGKTNLAVINTEGKTIRTYEKRKGKPYREYDYAFNEGVDDISPKHNETPHNFNSDITVFTSDGLYGYKSNYNITVPAQFSNAGGFANNCAIAALNGKYGIIVLMEGNFSSNIEPNEISFRYYKPSKLQYTLNIPETLNSELLQIRFDDGNGNLNPIQLEKSTYTFTPNIEKDAKTCTIRAEVWMDNLLLWKDDNTLEINRPTEPTLVLYSPAKETELAGRGNLLKIKAKVYNKNKTNTNVTVLFAVSGLTENSNSIIDADKEKLKPHVKTLVPGYNELSITFYVSKRETVNVRVSVNDGQQSKTQAANIELRPKDD